MCIIDYLSNKGFTRNKSAYVLLNLFNEFGQNDKMGVLLSFLSLFRNQFYKFNNTGALMLHSIYHMTLSIFCNHVFWCENV